MNDVKCFSCPACAGHVSSSQEALHCSNCDVAYPFRDGIPIFSEAGDAADLAEMADLVDILEAQSEQDFSSLAERFRLPNRPFHAGREASERRSLEGLFRRFPDLSQMNILDVSCGVGREAQILLSQGVRRMSLFDISYPAVRYARTQMERFFPDRDLGYAVGTAESLPFPDDSFDLVLVFASAHHYPDLEGFLAETRRVAPRTVLLSEPAVMGAAQWILNRVGWNTEYGGIDTQRLSEKELHAMSERLGMKAHTERSTCYFPRVLDRFGHLRPLVAAWFLGLRAIDLVTPSALLHSLNYYAGEP